MSVTSSRIYNPEQNKETFRVYRKISGKEYQEYYDDETEANERDANLGKLLDNSHPIEGYKTKFFHPHNLLHQGYDLGVVGIRVKYETRNLRAKPYLINSKGKRNPVTFALSSFDSVSDWVGAAIKDAFENAEEKYDKSELSRALEWSRTTECADVVLAELEYCRDSAGISIGRVFNTYSYMSNYGGALYIRSGVGYSGKFKLSLCLESPYVPNIIRSDRVLDSYYSLFDFSARLVAIVLSYSTIGERCPWQYAEQVYLTMVSEWRQGLQQTPEDYETELLGLGLTPSKWFSLVNQYGAAIYGSDLLV